MAIGLQCTKETEMYASSKNSIVLSVCQSVSHHARVLTVIWVLNLKQSIRLAVKFHVYALLGASIYFHS